MIFSLSTISSLTEEYISILDYHYYAKQLEYLVINNINYVLIFYTQLKQDELFLIAKGLSSNKDLFTKGNHRLKS